MDRRQKKTREAIFRSFIELLDDKNLSKITVSDIIEKADIGRATFYAHFETKDFLIKELCEELFCHIFDMTKDEESQHRHIFECDSNDTIFLHTLKHIKNNDNQLLALLSGSNNELFLGYFKDELIKMIETQSFVEEKVKEKNVPKDYYTEFVASSFVQTIKWWIDNKLSYTEDEVNRYFLSLI